ncbi:uncharacterized protein [Halyomorpha halys]|uniref:uncharacterized protein n=1 Tax=Halyomorpha halys TaxID=286706 RepID=UPI0006D51CA9|nr:uncharacterized protein LOC106677904 [Halyomorpha halys]
MTKLESTVKKDIIRGLNSAIDSEKSDDDNKAYCFYIESLSLIAEVLKKDSVSEDSSLTLRDKWNLIEFAKQSLSRVSILLRKEGPIPDGRVIDNSPLSPSAPADSNFQINSSPVSPLRDCDLSEEPIMMARYQRRIELAASALEKQNIELEMARQFVEKAAISRNRLVRATAWAMHHAHKKFQIQEKLHGGRLRESDLRKQQLYAVSLQFGEGNVWLTQLHQDLALYPNHEKIARELLDNVLTDSSHPIKATIDSMQDKVNSMITNAMINEKCESQPQLFDAICKVIQEDIGVVHDVLKALFEPLKTERNSIITSEAIHHVYFSQVKPALISLIRMIHKDVVEGLKTRIEDEYEESKADLPEECKEAVTKLHYLTTLHNPYDMLDCTVHIIKLLATSKFDKGHCTSIGADDLLPKLCQVLISSCLPTVCAEAYFMEAFMPSEKALGEEGYAVTMLQSAIAHLTMS